MHIGTETSGINSEVVLIVRVVQSAHLCLIYSSLISPKIDNGSLKMEAGQVHLRNLAG